MRQLTCWDLIALRLIEQNPSIPFRELLMCCNLFVLDQHVSSDYATVHISKISVEVAVDKLRFVGLVKPSGKLEVHTANAGILWDRIGKDWKSWPWYIPMDRYGQLLFEEMKERV